MKILCYAVPLERPSSKGRPPTYYHPLLQKEKDLDSIVHRILPKSFAEPVRPIGSRLAHLYGLPKTHKERLAMHPILSATQTYNYALTYDLNLTKTDLVDLLGVATKRQLFHFNGALYEQTDGVAMGSPLGPLLANVFISSIEENLEREVKLPSFYRRYVDDTLTIILNIATASNFLDTLNKAHSSIKFYDENWMKTEPIALNRDKGIRKTH